MALEKREAWYTALFNAAQTNTKQTNSNSCYSALPNQITLQGPAAAINAEYEALFVLASQQGALTDTFLLKQLEKISRAMQQKTLDESLSSKTQLTFKP